MIPLALFRNSTFTVSAIATFFATFGFATAIIFLPLWFQIVQGASSTASGYDLMPFLFGLIASSIASGQIVSRTGHYKWLLVASMALVAVGLTLFTNLRTETTTLNLWLWMIVTGIGVGPMMAVFTLIVQNAVPFRLLGTATSDLTLFRQIGTSVGLTVAFTVFENNLTWGLLRDQIIAKGAPAAAVPLVAPPGFNIGQDLTSVGGGSSTQFLTQVPAAAPADLPRRLPRGVLDRARELHVDRRRSGDHCRVSRRSSSTSCPCGRRTRPPSMCRRTPRRASPFRWPSRGATEREPIRTFTDETGADRRPRSRSARGRGNGGVRCRSSRSRGSSVPADRASHGWSRIAWVSTSSTRRSSPR